MVDLLLISKVRISPKRSNPAAEWVDTIWQLHTLLDVRRSPTVLHVYANLIRFRYVIKDSIQQERERVAQVASIQGGNQIQTAQGVLPFMRNYAGRLRKCRLNTLRRLYIFCIFHSAQTYDYEVYRTQPAWHMLKIP